MGIAVGEMNLLVSSSVASAGIPVMITSVGTTLANSNSSFSFVTLLVSFSAASLSALNFSTSFLRFASSNDDSRSAPPSLEDPAAGTELLLTLEVILGEGRTEAHDEEEPGASGWERRRDVDEEAVEERLRARVGAAGLDWDDDDAGGSGREEAEEATAGFDREEETGAVGLLVFDVDVDCATGFATEVVD